MIEFTNVSKSYGEVKVLNDISIKIKKGTVHGVIGQSGAGKSTLIRTINKLETIDEGQVIVNGSDIHRVDEKQLKQIRLQTGFIFQDFNLLSQLSVWENIVFPLKQNKLPIDNWVEELIDIVGLRSEVDKYPSQLSGGQRQRIAIARALVTNPQILLCDEATSALDSNTTNDILNLLLAINERLKITIVMVTHEIDVIKKVCDDVTVLKNGSVIESGDVFDIFVNSENEYTNSLINSNEIEDGGNQIKKTESFIVDFIYLNDNIQQHLLQKLANDLRIDFSVHAGTVTNLKNGSIGKLKVEFFGDKSGVEQYLQTNNILYKEVL